MRISPFIIIFFFIVSCGSSKKLAEQQIGAMEKKTIISMDTLKIAANTESSEDKTMGKPIPEEKIDGIPKVLTTFDHGSWNKLLQKHVTKNGNVNYKGFKTDKALLKNYLDQLSENTVQESWGREDKLAYWINAYNAFTVKLIVDNYPTKSIKDIKDPWDYRNIKIGGKWLTLNDIEHTILRKMEEPRIHFAINCASVSCPKLSNEAFVASKLEDQLNKVTKEFLSDSTRNEITADSLKISKIFRWFAKDFKKDGTLIDFLDTYSDIGISDKAKISFKDYDWNLNE